MAEPPRRPFSKGLHMSHVLLLCLDHDLAQPWSGSEEAYPSASAFSALNLEPLLGPCIGINPWMGHYEVQGIGLLNTLNPGPALPRVVLLHLASSSGQTLFVPAVCFLELWGIKKPVGINIWVFFPQYPPWCPRFWVGGHGAGGHSRCPALHAGTGGQRLQTSDGSRVASRPFHAPLLQLCMTSGRRCAAQCSGSRSASLCAQGRRFL